MCPDTRLLPRKVLHTNGFRLSVHFYIILPATLIMQRAKAKEKFYLPEKP